MTLVNTVCRLAARPIGLPKPSDFEVVDQPAGDPADGEFLVRVEYLSVDPAMRTWMNAGRSYVPPVEIGEVMRAGGIGRVIDSRHPDFAAGDEVYGVFGVQRYAVSDGTGVTPVDTSVAPAPVHLGALGIGGLTAYFGLLDVGRPQPGKPSPSPVPPVRWAASPARSPGSTAAVRSASPVARTSVAGWWTSSDSTPPSTTRRLICGRS